MEILEGPVLIRLILVKWFKKVLGKYTYESHKSLNSRTLLGYPEYGLNSISLDSIFAMKYNTSL